MVNEISRAEIMLYEWQYETLGSFHTGLYNCIAKADIHNTEMLRLSYPEEVEAVSRYQHEDGYWADVKLRMELFKNKDLNVPEITHLQNQMLG